MTYSARAGLYNMILHFGLRSFTVKTQLCIIILATRLFSLIPAFLDILADTGFS